MDELEAIKVTFFQECEELLADLEGGLLAMQEGVGDSETVNAVFRAVHSIKGGAGAFGLEPLVRFAHVFETLLDAVRSNEVPGTVDLAAVMLRASDVLADHVSAARGMGDVDMAASAAMAAELKAWTDPSAAPVAAAPVVETAQAPSASDPAPVAASDDLDDVRTKMTEEVANLRSVLKSVQGQMDEKEREVLRAMEGRGETEKLMEEVR